MAYIAIAPHAMVQKKPAHGAPCTRCGLCCYTSLCDVAQTIHHRKEGPCPELRFDADGSRCGLIDRSEGGQREAAKLLINSGKGCDMKLRDEPRNLRYDSQCETFDRKHRAQLAIARALWGMT